VDLKAYLFEKRGRLADLSRKIGAHASDVSRWASGYRPIPVQFGWPIERETGGLVTREELFPDKWREIWPELAVKTINRKMP
jgi:DNA-binding transcriptional regulator YdaS (Cro superfamily)